MQQHHQRRIAGTGSPPLGVRGAGAHRRRAPALACRRAAFLLLLLLLSATSVQGQERPTLGLALSGGGAKGLAHVGVLKVMEEAGLDPDVVTGTSMGAVVGGLYAIGTTVAELESLAVETDWVDLFDDTPSRRDMAVERKIYDARYVADLPVKGWRVQLPSGLIHGQQISELLTRMTQPVHSIADFRQFPRAFSCIATDLATGEAVVFDEGFLPDAIRASMSIPSVFTPVELDSTVYIDGFVGRNLPVVDAFRLGADIVIAVDVETPLRDPEEVEGLVDIVQQTMWFAGVEENRRQRELADLLAQPDVRQYKILDFYHAEELIERGERAAREMLPRLRALADSLDAIAPPASRYQPITPDSLYISEVRFEGLEELDSSFLVQMMKVEAGDWAAREEVDGDVRRLYSTQFFERVTYRLESGPEGTHLVVRVVEHRADHLRFGFHYNSQTKVAALINYTRNNLLFDGSLATLDLRLGQTNAQEVAWFLPVPGMRRYGLRARFAASETKDVALPVDTLGGFFKYDREHTESELLAGTLFSTRAVLGAGLRSYWDLYDPQTEDPAELRRFRREVSMLEAYGLYYYDTLDRLYFPTSGSRLHLEAAHSLHDFVEASQYYRWLLEGSANIPLAPRVTLEASLTLGYFSNPEISPTPRFSFGGDASFFGADFGELHGDAVQVLRGAVRWEAFQRAFIGSQVNVGRASSRWRWMDGAALEYGYGLVLGYLTPFGPIMWQVHRGSRSDARTFLQVGYSF